MRFPLPPLPQASGLGSWSYFLPQLLTEPKRFVPACWTLRPLSCTPLAHLWLPGSGRYKRSVLWPPCFSSSLDACIYCLSGVGVGEEEGEDREQTQAQGPIQSSVYPGLPHGCGGGREQAHLQPSGPHSPKLPGRPPWCF